MKPDRPPVEVVIGEDGRWVLGDRNACCHHCRAPAAVHYASNGRAEFWHAPTDCCDWARARERRFSAMSREDGYKALDRQEAAARATAAVRAA